MKISLGINLNKPMELNHENELRITIGWINYPFFEK